MTLSVITRDEEKDEVTRVFASGILGRSTNLAKMFRVICDRYFENSEASVKEYTIAVEGFGRPLDFDPHLDPVVRVTAHLLRKRLGEFYSAEGATHALHILLPRGRYCLQFVRPASQEPGTPEIALAPPPPAPQESEIPPAPAPNRRMRLWLMASASVALLGLCAFCIFALQSVAAKHRVQAMRSSLKSATVIPAGKTFRMLVGADRPPLTDQTGNQWQSDQFCTEGESYRIASRKIMGTVSPELFFGGRRGRFHCAFPVAPGLYEAHLYFAETAEVDDATQRSVFSFNGRPAKGVDVVDYAPGENAATEKLVPGLEPGTDGKIHLDFWEAASFLNAVELVPAKTSKLSPIRINIANKDSMDTSGKLWLSDRFFTGGRLSLSTSREDGSNDGEPRSSRVGHFVYSIPVESGAKYTVRLLFTESWFGNQEGKSGSGRRRFDVTCNGVILLKNFDIFAESGKKPLVKTFTHIEPNGLGKIDLTFIPIDNYAMVNGIEVIEE